MTSKKFYSKSFLINRLTSNWYLALISSIVFFLSGPFALLLNYSYEKKNYPGLEFKITIDEYLKTSTLKFFNGSESLFLYILAYIMATIIGLILFSYMNNRQQVNFYHSQPLSRRKLFFDNYFASLILGLVPLIIMFLISIGIAISTVGISDYLSNVPKHIIGFSSFYLCGLSVTVLACQLTGSTIFSIYVIGFLNFLGPFLSVTFVSILTSNQNKLNISYDFVDFLSPLTFLVSRNSTPISYKGVLAYLTVSIICTVIGYMLYKIRLSESAGNTIIYKSSGSFIKYVSAFVFSAAFSLMTANIDHINSILFLLSFAMIFFISSLFMEVAFRRSFKNIKRILPTILITTIIATSAVYCSSFITDRVYTKIPDVSKVKTVSFKLGNDYFYYNTDGDTNNFLFDDFLFNDSELIEASLDVVSKIVANGNYDNDLSSTKNTTTLYIKYNNSPIERIYNNINIDLLMEELSNIYENPKYKNRYIKLLQDSINDINNVNNLSFSHNMKDGRIVSYYPYESNNIDNKYKILILEAIIKDITSSKYADSLVRNDYENISFNIYNAKDGIYKNFNIYIFDNCPNFKNVINQILNDPNCSQSLSFSNSLVQQ
ncbi:MAG: hypothetical protein ACRDA4_02855 [Filifactoraceae bacterium]